MFAEQGEHSPVPVRQHLAFQLSLDCLLKVLPCPVVVPLLVQSQREVELIPRISARSARRHFQKADRLGMIAREDQDRSLCIAQVRRQPNQIDGPIDHSQGFLALLAIFGQQ